MSFFSRDRRMNDNIITLLPVTRSSDTVLITQLKRVNDTQDFIKVTTSRGRVRQDQTDGLLGVNDEHGANSEWNTLVVNVGGILMIQHVIKSSDLAISISNDGEVELNVANIVDISNPLFVITELVGRKTNDIDITSIPFILESSNETKFGGADRSYTIFFLSIATPITRKK